MVCYIIYYTSCIPDGFGWVPVLSLEGLVLAARKGEMDLCSHDLLYIHVPEGFVGVGGVSILSLVGLVLAIRKAEIDLCLYGLLHNILYIMYT